jgi:hypothetical protein
MARRLTEAEQRFRGLLGLDGAAPDLEDIELYALDIGRLARCRM